MSINYSIVLKSFSHLTFICLHTWLIKRIHAYHQSWESTSIHHRIHPVAEMFWREALERHRHTRTATIIMSFCGWLKGDMIELVETTSNKWVKSVREPRHCRYCYWCERIADPEKCLKKESSPLLDILPKRVKICRITEGIWIETFSLFTVALPHELFPPFSEEIQRWLHGYKYFRYKPRLLDLYSLFRIEKSRMRGVTLDIIMGILCSSYECCDIDTRDCERQKPNSGQDRIATSDITWQNIGYIALFICFHTESTTFYICYRDNPFSHFWFGIFGEKKITNQSIWNSRLQCCPWFWDNTGRNSLLCIFLEDFFVFQSTEVITEKDYLYWWWRALQRFNQGSCSEIRPSNATDNQDITYLPKFFGCLLYIRNTLLDRQRQIYPTEKIISWTCFILERLIGNLERYRGCHRMIREISINVWGRERKRRHILSGIMKHFYYTQS